jgi:hypothetical protein
MASYRDSIAYQRSNRLRHDGRPLWPVTVEDYPSLPEAHRRVAEREKAKKLARRVQATRS